MGGRNQLQLSILSKFLWVQVNADWYHRPSDCTPPQHPAEHSVRIISFVHLSYFAHIITLAFMLSVFISVCFSHFQLTFFPFAQHKKILGHFPRVWIFCFSCVEILLMKCWFLKVDVDDASKWISNQKTDFTLFFSLTVPNSHLKSFSSYTMRFRVAFAFSYNLNFVYHPFFR